MAVRPSYLPINGTRGSKATITTLMTVAEKEHAQAPGPKASFTYTGS